MAWQQSIQAAVRELRKEERALQRKLTEVQARIRDLEAIGVSAAEIKSGRVTRKKTGSRRLSAEGRAAISKAAKKRWAKYRRAQKSR